MGGMIEINGALGEGGGQVLRSALTLSMLTGQGFHITNIRQNRKKPGLKTQSSSILKSFKVELKTVPNLNN